MIWPSEKGELVLHENLALVSPLQVHSLSSVSKNSITMKRNRTGTTLSPCLNLTLNSIVVSNSPMTNLNTMYLYTLLIVSHRFGGNPYFARIITINWWFDELKALKRSEKANQVGRLWLWRRWSSVFIVNVISWQPCSFNGLSGHYPLLSHCVRATLQLSSKLSSRSQSDHVFNDTKPVSLISMGKLCDDDCVAIFTKLNMKILKHNRVIITGLWDRTNGLWDI